MSRRACAVLLLDVGLLWAGASPSPAATTDRLNLARSVTARGEASLKKKHYGRAEKQFRRAIETEPALPTAHLGLGSALIGQQRYDEALTTLAETERRFVEWEQRIQMADLTRKLVASRQMLQIQDLSAAVRARGNASSPSMAEAMALSMSAQAAERLETEQFILRERWDLEGLEAIPSQVFYLEGIAYLRTGRREQGIEALETCLLVNQDHRLAHYNLAVALFTRGEFEAAKTHLDAAVAGGIEPDARFVADLEKALNQLSR